MADESVHVDEVEPRAAGLRRRGWVTLGVAAALLAGVLGGVAITAGQSDGEPVRTVVPAAELEETTTGPQVIETTTSAAVTAPPTTAPPATAPPVTDPPVVAPLPPAPNADPATTTTIRGFPSTTAPPDYCDGGEQPPHDNCDPPPSG